MENVLKGLEPKLVLHYFEELTKIPHGSRNTKAISDYCAAFARERKLFCRQDSFHNVLIRKPASVGYETHPGVIVQGHLDMVCEKEPDCDLDFEKDALRLRRDGDFIFAEGTTLGGDDGIAVAYALALLDDDSIPHPPLEVILTVDEEIGMLGAAAMDLSDVQGRRLLNIDSEDEGILTVSCAGGATSEIRLPICPEAAEGVGYTLRVCGLQGGHSGTEINAGRLNANVMLTKLLDSLCFAAPLRLISIQGGGKDNAIARSAEAAVLVAPEATQRFEVALQSTRSALLEKGCMVEAGLEITAEKTVALHTDALREEASRNAVSLLAALPNGVQAMSKDIPGLVQTSLNMGIVRMDAQQLSATFSVRSSVNEEKAALIAELQRIAAQHGAVYSESGAYPAWEYRQDSVLRDTMISVFEELYGKKPTVEAIHAGLECGILSGKLPGLDAVSFGPNMHDIHTTREKLDIASAKRTWDYLLAVLKRL